MAQADKTETKTSSELVAQFFGAGRQRELAEKKEKVRKGGKGGGRSAKFLGAGRFIARIDSFKLEQAHPSKGGKTYAAMRGVLVHKISGDEPRSDKSATQVGEDYFYGIWGHTGSFMEDLIRALSGILDCEPSDLDMPMVAAALSDKEATEKFTVLSVDDDGNEVEEEVEVELTNQPLKGFFVEVNGVKRPQMIKTGEHAGKQKVDEVGEPKFFTNIYINGAKTAVELAELLSEDEIRRFVPDLEERLAAEAEAAEEEEDGEE